MTTQISKHSIEFLDNKKFNIFKFHRMSIKMTRGDITIISFS